LTAGMLACVVFVVVFVLIYDICTLCVSEESEKAVFVYSVR